MKKFLIAALITLLTFQAAAQVHYSIEANESVALINSTVEMECDRSCPGLTWLKPDGAEVTEVRDGDGPVEYTENQESVKIEGEFSSKDTRVLRITMREENYAEEIHSGLMKATFRLSGFENQETSGRIHVENLISGKTGYGFTESFENESMNFRGEGPVNVRVKFGDGFETRYFSFFGQKVSNVSSAYEIAVGTTGIVQRFDRFPVAVLTDQEYDEKLNEWSAGEYVDGAIQIRSPEAFEQRNSASSFEAVLAHEVVHGLNDRLMDWDSTRSSYLDEGTSKYVEMLVNRKRYSEGLTDNKPPNLFGEEQRYEVEKNGKRYIYTVPSRGDREQLWNYYQENRSFMKQWNAFEASESTRSFGYAYSELIVRNYVASNNSLRELYDELDIQQRVDDPETKWRVLSERIDLTPCSYNSRERFEACLENVNSYDYPVYTASPEPGRNTVEVEEIRLPNRTSTTGEVTGTGFLSFLQGFIGYIVEGVGSLFSGL